MSWTPDGKVLVISSLEGYNTFVTFSSNAIGEPCEDQDAVKLLNCIKDVENSIEVDNGALTKLIKWPDSPKLIVPKKTPKPKKESILISSDGVTDVKTQPTNNAPLTPFVIIKRKKPDNSSPAASPLGIKRKKDVENLLLKTPSQEKKDNEKQSLSVQKKINELW